MIAPVCAVVVAQRGGEALRRLVAAVGWAAEIVVVDPMGRGAATPPGVRRVDAGTALAAATGAGWLLLLADDETGDARLAAAVGAAVARGRAAWRLPRELAALGSRFRPRHAPVRLAPRDGARLVVAAGAELALASPAPSGGVLDAVVTVDRAHDLDAALPALDADTTVLARLLDAGGTVPHVHRLPAAFALAAWRVLRAPATPAPGLGRWVVAVLSGYRALVADAKLWEGRSVRRPELLA